MTNTVEDAPVAPGAAGPPVVRVRYWAGARTAAGTADEQVQAVSIGELRRVLVDRHPALAAVLDVASLMVDGRTVTGDAALAPGATVEVLPPFAGG